jgi:predicted aminopeptidase
MAIRALLLAAAALLTCGCATPAGYLAKQGKYLLRDSMGARSARSLLASPRTDARTRALLLRAEEIRRYAFERIGLKRNGNFARYKQLDRDHLVSVVSACAADSFTPFTWRYPLLGRLPYRGFYERADADREAARLAAEGWDVVVRPVDSFSTLGFTRDPLYSFMSDYTAYELASLILHEQTHATLFVKGQTQFSEELASFVGEQGALDWLAGSAGSGSAEYRQALDQIADERAFEERVRGLRGALEGVYSSALSRERKLQDKERLIADFQDGFEREKQDRFRTESYRAMRAPRLNNAYLSLFSLYSDDIPLIRSYFERLCDGDLRRLLVESRAMARRGDVKEQMRRALVADGVVPGAPVW